MSPFNTEKERDETTPPTTTLIQFEYPGGVVVGLCKQLQDSDKGAFDLEWHFSIYQYIEYLLIGRHTQLNLNMASYFGNRYVFLFFLPIFILYFIIQ